MKVKAELMRVKSTQVIARITPVNARTAIPAPQAFPAAQAVQFFEQPGSNTTLQ